MRSSQSSTTLREALVSCAWKVALNMFVAAVFRFSARLVMKGHSLDVFTGMAWRKSLAVASSISGAEDFARQRRTLQKRLQDSFVGNVTCSRSEDLQPFAATSSMPTDHRARSKPWANVKAAPPASSTPVSFFSLAAA